MYVIGASAAGAVCIGLCGLYVLYRRRAKNMKVKVAVKVVNTESTDGPQRRDDWYAASMKQNERAIPVLYSDVRYTEPVQRTSSAAHSSSFNVSSLHTSEHSASEHLKDYDSKEADNDIENYRNGSNTKESDHSDTESEETNSQSNSSDDESSEDAEEMYEIDAVETTNDLHHLRNRLVSTSVGECSSDSSSSLSDVSDVSEVSDV